ncbi:TDP-N-acetylfucosamine:lipid II N-acetylfucosaminyltransferase [Clostridium estertheticum]|uniref:Uncharacterized protein n=1 Tax=Clostridium estertheticum subsp. estertheticum TaxID=1552 RepID=A0A1J0GKZ2_9CLOT|nr:TDP-N-acetylfucosamine:lipid II N-acetylfucosaminyltransferase [Clostridium estertheticum]APC41943.1 hypothetical protein A7L45_18675 [Clostridium estertheticum subsp. estertheticum]
MKYLHIMAHESTIHNSNILELFQSFKKDLNISNYFIFACKEPYTHFQERNNVKYNSNILKRGLTDLKSMYKEYDIVFIHSFYLRTFRLIFLNKGLCHKIVWCVWGHDLYNRVPYLNQDKNIFKYLDKKLNLHIMKKKVRDFIGIGIGYKYDSLEVKKLFGDLPYIYRMPYPLGYTMNEVKKYSNPYVKGVKKSINIMIGHSGFPFLNHKSVLDSLLKFKNENIKIYIPFIYGDDLYMDGLEKYAKENFGNKVNIMRTKLGYCDYIKFVSEMDIAVFDVKHQTALANIYLLLYFGKKLYLSDRGILYQGLDLENIEVCGISEIKHCSFDEFCKPIENPLCGKKFSETVLDEESIKKMWYKSLKYIKYHQNFERCD